MSAAAEFGATEAERIAAEIDLAWKEHELGACRLPSRRRRDLLPQMAERQNWRCCYCGERMDGQGDNPNAPSVEHVIPLSKGGTDAPGNLVAACRRCNSKRSSTYWLEHRQALVHARISRWPQPQETPDA